MLRRAESIGFVEGSNWDERLAGTNAPGMALRLDQSVNVIGAEHFRRSVQRWSCAATTIHDPSDQSVLGVLDITGGDDIVVPQTMAMVRAAARMAESELARELLVSGRAAQPQTPSARGLSVLMESLGRNDALLTVDDGRGHRRTVRLSPRHSEILLLLASAPRGLSGDELAVLLYEEDSTASTLRVELGRLRSLLGDDAARLAALPPRRPSSPATGSASRRTSPPATSRARCAPTADRCCRARPRPGVVRLRESVEGDLRRAVLAQRPSRPDVDVDALGVGRRRLRDVAGPARRARARLAAAAARRTDQIARLDRELGTA